MAIIENRSTEIGDVIYIKAEVPIVGLIALTGFIDQTQNEAVNKLFYKEFRYSTDGFNWVQWKELTVANVAAVEVTPTGTFYIEYRYTRTGSDASGTLAFDSVELQGEVTEMPCGPIFDQSVFSQLIDCHQLDVIQWCVNVLEKIYSKGIVPNYITRSKGAATLDEDEDYLIFWRTICCYFSLFVIYARQFENIQANEVLLLEYIIERGLLICSNADVTSLNYLREHFYDEIRRRGTILVAKPSGYSNLQINGELLRLICWKETDEFIFALLEPQKVGWNIGNSSPMYKGLEGISMMVKGYEKSKNVTDLDSYGLTNPSYCSMITDGDKEVLSIDNVPAGEFAGIETEMFYINPYMDYEISFFCKQADLAEVLSVDIVAKNLQGNIFKLRRYPYGSYNSTHCERVRMNRNDIYYQVRFFLYRTNSALNRESVPNLKTGSHLYIVSDEVVSIQPRILLDNTLGSSVSGQMLLWDIKFRPLRTPDDYSLGFIHSNNFIEMYAKNNNALASDAEAERTIRQYLIPYDSTIHHHWLI